MVIDRVVHSPEHDVGDSQLTEFISAQNQGRLKSHLSFYSPHGEMSFGIPREP
jgi:hypothetical protein